MSKRKSQLAQRKPIRSLSALAADQSKYGQHDRDEAQIAQEYERPPTRRESVAQNGRVPGTSGTAKAVTTTDRAWLDANGYRLVVTDSGCHGMGWWFQLPSHGWCFFELAVWWRLEHATDTLWESVAHDS